LLSHDDQPGKAAAAFPSGQSGRQIRWVRFPTGIRVPQDPTDEVLARLFLILEDPLLGTLSTLGEENVVAIGRNFETILTDILPR
jgi:hypothetical protein